MDTVGVSAGVSRGVSGCAIIAGLSPQASRIGEKGPMDDDPSFGRWLQHRRRSLDLTQDDLGRCVSCSGEHIRFIEADRRRPSREVAERLATCLEIAEDERPAFVRVARGERGVEHLEATLAPPRSALTASLPADKQPRVLPRGTVTFLFTDLVSSTRLWERHGEAMAAALACHDALLRAAIAAHHGTIVKQTGDGVHAAFARAGDALAAALAAQRALQQEAWADVVVRVRMALHSGEADERDGDYYGLVVNRAARLLEVAHGGQILLSRATAELVEEQLPPGVTLRELGQHQLKDLTRPEQIVQLVAPDLPADFPPLKTVDNHPHNLPAQRDRLIGREGDVAAVAALILRDDVGLVTLTGSGGVGKTRLSQRVATELLDRFADGVWCVDLAPLTDPALVASTIATTLGLKDVGGEPLLQMLQAYLREKQLLLLLDNFEQVVAAAPFIAELLAAAPRLKVLVTSRTLLHLQTEHKFPVPPLRVPDPRHVLSVETLTHYAAVALFVQRAQAANPGFAVTSANADAIGEICRRLDGLPLAIELAAARIKLLPAEALLSRLQHRLRILTGGARDLPERQQTLRSTIDWSYSLLNEGDQQLFARLGVFVGSWTIEAMEAVCDPHGDLPMDVLDGLASLSDKSLVHREEGVEDEVRFMMLETLREYALERLQLQNEMGAVRQAHGRYYLALAEQAAPELTGPEQVVWLHRIDREYDNLRAALQWVLEEGGAETAARLSLSLIPFWSARGMVSEGRRWLEELLSLGDALPLTCYGEALAELSRFLWIAGESMRSVTLAEESLALFRELGDLSHIGKALWHLALTLRSQGDYARAVALVEECLEIARKHGDRRAVAWGTGLRGAMAADQGQYERAAALEEETLRMARERGDERCIAWALRELAVVARAQGDLPRAGALGETALASFRALSDQEGISWLQRDLGMIARLAGDYHQAGALGEVSLLGFRERADKTGIAWALIHLAQLALDQADMVAAQARLVESHALFQGFGNKHGLACCWEELALQAVALGDTPHAARLLGAASALREVIGVPIPPVDHSRYLPTIALIRAQVGEAAWIAARRLTPEQAEAYASAWLRDRWSISESSSVVLIQPGEQ